MDDLGVTALTLVGVAVWMGVVARAVHDHVDLVVLAFVLIVLGIVGAQFLAVVGVRAPGSWAWTITGVALMLLWNRAPKRR